MGRRVANNTNPMFLQPGDVVLNTGWKRYEGGKLAAEIDPFYMVAAPKGQIVNLKDYDVTRHKDGTISVAGEITLPTKKGEQAEKITLSRGEVADVAMADAGEARK